MKLNYTGISIYAWTIYELLYITDIIIPIIITVDFRVIQT